MKKKLMILGILLLLAALILWLALGRQSAAPVEYHVELLENGGFERVNDEGVPNGWLPEAYLKYSDVTSFDMTEGRDGKAVQIINYSPNDARYYQIVKVTPNTVYRFSGYIKSDAQGGRGANLSIADVYVFSEAVYQTDQDWQYVELYGKTGAKQHQVTVFARLGGYSGEAEGEAAFDQLSLMAVKETPPDVQLASWEKKEVSKQDTNVENHVNKPFAPWLILIYIVSAGLLLYIAKAAQRMDGLQTMQDTNRRTMILFFLLLLFAFLSRIWMASLISGFPVDVSAFRAWANNMADVGSSQFYLQEGHRDYPPGYMLVLWPIGVIGQLLGGGATAMMVKVPTILCDVAIIALLYQVAQKRTSKSAALTLSMLYTLNPLTYLAGAAWGQVDSLPSLLLLIAVLLIIVKRWRYALPVYVIAVLMKPQALMVGPLGLLALVMAFVWERKRDKLIQDALIGVALSFAVIALIAVPFFNEQNGVTWLLGLYGNTMSYYHYATVNANNLYFLFKQNWVSITNAAPFLLRLTGSFVVLAPVAFYLYLQRKETNNGKKSAIKRLDVILLAAAVLPAIAVLIPINLALTGTLLMISVFAVVSLMYIKSRDARRLPLLAAVLLIGFSILGTMMHERYLFLAVALLTLSYVQKPDRRVLALLLTVTALCFLNSGIALDRGMRIGGSMGNLDAPSAGLKSDSAWLEYSLSFLSLPLASYAIYLGLVFSKKDVLVKSIAPSDKLTNLNLKTRYAFLKKREQVKFDRKDALIIIGVTLVYSIIALVNLGSTKAPQTHWMSTVDQPQAVLDLGEVKHFKLMLYGGIHWQDSEFEVEISEDGEDYTSYPYQMTHGTLFAWRYLSFPYVDYKGVTQYDGNPRELTGRYVRISNMSARLTLFEVVAQDFDTGENIPFVSASAGANALIDEQDTVHGRPTWFNSMYFDEIYHARTGFEQRNALLGEEPDQIYETSHPPLGKVFITFSTMIFGMTPFGWRFAGALAGILMLPGMYLLGKQLTRRRGLGLFAMLLMTFDFMHFTQTRIATIDSFVTLFIIYSYFFMIRYIMMDHLRVRLKSKLLPLFLSGLMMGLGVASKWTGIYAGIGLAVLFFGSLAQNILSGFACKRLTADEFDSLDAEEAKTAQAFGQGFIHDAVLTCLWCLLFFVAVPIVIYYLSYIPVYIASPGGVTIQKIIRNNISMFDYHSEPGRGADHQYYSPWHSWPIIKKPMYYYSGGVINGTSSVIWAFGNPLVWWGGLLALVMTAFYALYERLSVNKRLIAYDKGELLSLSYDRRPLILLLAFLAQYLPWVLVPRGTYIYHYFPSVPFIILCMTLMMEYLYQWHKQAAKVTCITLVIIAGVLFIAFFPYISGVRVSTAWLEAMRWLPNWLYY
ncbi:MAG: phospholipid carrier-dependent glycosyltransferase [Clostridiales bacterium]|nr:phospholipid carrier-dependent glycosyltransferase [Clostridiales bacterium]